MKNLSAEQLFDLSVELRCLAARSRALATRCGKGACWDIGMDIAADLTAVANKLQTAEPPKVVERSGKPRIEQLIVNGKRVMVQRRRMPFAVHV